MPVPAAPPIHVRAAFLSDIHLGTRDCRADLLLDFLHRVHADTLYLVGDIIDVWSLKRGFYWPQQHNNVLRTLLGKAKHGTRIIYIPGNHDAELRDFDASVFGQVEVRCEALHTTADGRRLLVMHGDEFDTAVQCSRWLLHLGTWMYDLALQLNRTLNVIRRRWGYPYWSLASYLKSRVGNARQYVEGFEFAAARAAQRRGLDGIVCGHIHRPLIREIGGVTYCNDGDWVENCSVLIESRAGVLELWHWADQGLHAQQRRAA